VSLPDANVRYGGIVAVKAPGEDQSKLSNRMFVASSTLV
jgi:hypothetical protein